jgi:hypothetical protein
MPRLITAFSNPLVKQVRGLRDKKERRREGLFMAEGLRILTEAREAGRLPRILFFNGAEPPHPLLRTLIEEIEAAGGDVVETNADILSKLSGKDNPGTVIGVFDAFPTGLDRIDRTSADIWIVAQSLPRSRQSRHHPAHRRRGRRGRADPRRRLRRPFSSKRSARRWARCSRRRSPPHAGTSSCPGSARAKAS